MAESKAMLGAAASGPVATMKLNEKDYERNEYKKRDYSDWGEEDEDQQGAGGDPHDDRENIGRHRERKFSEHGGR
mgnify:CR=1 FL=1